MTRKFVHLRRLAIAILAVVGGGVAATDASAAVRTLTYQCSYPLIGSAPVSVKITADIPTSVPAGVMTSGWAVDIAATSSGHTFDGFSLIAAERVEGSTRIGTTLDIPGQGETPLALTFPNDPEPIPTRPTDPVFDSHGLIPSITFGSSGVARLRLDSFALSLRAVRQDGTAIIFPGSATDSDGDSTTFDVDCSLDPDSQDTTLAAIQVGSGGPPTTPVTTPIVTTPRTTPVTTPTTTPVTTPPTTPVTTPPTTRVLTYQCTYPLIGEAPVSATVRASAPPVVRAGDPVPGWAVNISSVLSGNTYTGFSLIGAKEVQGSVLVSSTVHMPGGLNLPVAIPTAVQPYGVPNTAGDLTMNSAGQSPSLVFPSAGSASITVDRLAFSLKALKSDGTAVIFPGSDTDSDRDPDTFDVSCRLDPASQDTLLTSFTITTNTTPVTTPVTTPPVTTPRTTPATTPRTTPTTTSPTTPKTTPVTTPRTTPPTTPTGPCACVAYAYGLAGTATMRTLVKGTLPITGTIRQQFSIATGQFTADLALQPATAKLKTMGFLPVMATLEFAATQKATGNLTNGILSVNAVVRIKLPSVTLFGLELAEGASCQARQSSNLVLKTADNFFSPRSGGTLAGMFSVSDLTGCAFMDGMVSTSTAARANAIAVKFSP